MPKVPPRPGPRKSNAGTPNPGDDGPPLAEKLSYYDFARPFKSATFHSHLNTRTASGSTTSVKKNAKQILTLERERYGGGDGFLSAAQTLAKARGEPIEMGGKKKKVNPIGRVKVLSGAAARGKAGKASGAAGDIGGGGGGSSSKVSEDEDGEEGDEDGIGSTIVKNGVNGKDGVVSSVEGGGGGGPRKEIFTYHTPTAPPSLLPPKKYCDITGLHASYTDPRSKLRYKGLEVWHVVRGLGPGGDQAYLAVRGAQTSLK
ncbi:hypothetical protein BCR39DRAFT_518394 [Naematelia encephala]|uniref:Vps72/YL1 C-terminal domain-containing protein n=1 Tax=Naematelia encephala TaxID=71784 RepID=A0A1Y2BH04_9TREE|nr:hypothetical protein BCR39DRAFT_518394 [Naematelia encephala]